MMQILAKLKCVYHLLFHFCQLLPETAQTSLLIRIAHRLLVLQVNNNLRAAEGRMHKMQGVISTEGEAEKCLSGLLERMHSRVIGLVQAAPEAVDLRAKELHIAPRIHQMLESYKNEVRRAWHLLCCTPA